jgi:hypothetical protein
MTTTEETTGNSEIVLRFDVPEGMSHDEAVAAVKELLDAADDFHRALGGQGIKLKRATAKDHIPRDADTQEQP